MRISDWSSDVCSSDLHQRRPGVCMTFQSIGRFSAKAGRKSARFGGRVLIRVLRAATDEAMPDLAVPPSTRAVDLPERGTTHVLIERASRRERGGQTV